MRILLLSEGNAETWDSWSGSAHSLLQHLRAAGHEVVVGDVECRGPSRWYAAAQTFSIDRQRWSSRFHLGAVPFELRSRIAGRHIKQALPSIDLILQIGATFQPYGRGTKPYAVYCDSNIEFAQRAAATGYSDAYSLKPVEIEAVRARETAVYKDAEMVFTMSEHLRQSFIAHFGVPEERVRTVYAGLNLELSRIPQRVPGAEQDDPTILFVGRQFERKGGDVLLRAFAMVREQLPAARLIIVGPPTLPVSAPGVELLGFLDKASPAGWDALMRAYANADVFCMPSRFEPFGIAFLEAMFFGLPCVGTNAWAIPEMIVDNETGFLVDNEDADALAGRLLLLLNNRERGQQMGQAGRRRAEANFTWGAVVERMEQSLFALADPRQQLVHD